MAWRGCPSDVSARLLADQVIFKCLSNPTAFKDQESDGFKLIFYQCMVLQFSLSEPLSPPTSITGCKDLIKSSVFVNIAEYRNIVIHRRPLKNLTMCGTVPQQSSPPESSPHGAEHDLPAPQRQ